MVFEGNRIIGKNAMYTIDNHVFEKLVFYRNEYHGNKDVLKFIDLSDRRDGLYISDKDVSSFNRYLMNSIKNEIIISDYPLGDSADEQISIYGDIDETDTISLTIQSEIDGNRIYGFSDSDVKSALLEKVEDFVARYAYKIDNEIFTAYLDNNDENTFTFINEGLTLLQNYCDVYISDNLKKLGVAQKYNISVGVRVNNHLLDIDISSIDIPNEELNNVLNSYRKKKKYHKLKNGDLLYLNSEDLESLDNLLIDYDIKIKDIEDNHAQVGLYRAFSLDDKANMEENLLVNREDSFNELISKFKNVDLQDYPIQKPYDTILRDYQKDGYKWLKCLNAYSFGGILADDMGLGKTLQVIALIESLIGTGNSIVVCPSSLILNWVDEVHKFSDKVKVIGIYGNQAYRAELIRTIDEYDLIITSYDYIRRDFELFEEKEFNYIILDEAQYIKNKNTKNAKSVKMLKGINRLALTGTPIENTLAELWSIFDFLMPGYLYNYHYFKNNFETPIVKEHDEEKEKSLKQLIQPFILRRNKKDVLKELPDKIEHKLEFVFNDEEKKLYYGNLALVNETLKAQLNVKNVDKIAILAMLTRLRQICIEPRLIYDDIESISSKMSGCLDLLGQLVENRQKVLLFSSFTSVLDLLADELDKRHYSYYKLTGSTNKTKRHQLVKDFQDDDTMIFLISLKAGGTGLNLTSAQAVIHFDPWWNVSAQNQATDRAYRIGQKNNVQVFKLIMKDSIEEKILEMQSTKKDLADAFVENNTGTITKMNVSELMDLFK
jgi:SNF2 family DNA or RNA helicase